MGRTKGKIGLRGGKVDVERPRVRGLDGEERILPSWKSAVGENWLGEWAMNQMLIAVSTRKFERLVRLPGGRRAGPAGRRSVEIGDLAALRRAVCGAHEAMDGDPARPPLAGLHEHHRLGTARRVCRNVKHWRSPSMAMRWTAAGMIEAKKGFRRLKAHEQLPALRAALDRKKAAAEPPIAQIAEAASLSTSSAGSANFNTARGIPRLCPTLIALCANPRGYLPPAAFAQTFTATADRLRNPDQLRPLLRRRSLRHFPASDPGSKSMNFGGQSTLHQATLRTTSAAQISVLSITWALNRRGPPQSEGA